MVARGLVAKWRRSNKGRAINRTACLAPHGRRDWRESVELQLSRVLLGFMRFGFKLTPIRCGEEGWYLAAVMNVSRLMKIMNVPMTSHVNSSMLLDYKLSELLKWKLYADKFGYRINKLLGFHGDPHLL